MSSEQPYEGGNGTGTEFLKGAVVEESRVNLAPAGLKRRLETEAGQNIRPCAAVAGGHALNPEFIRSVHQETLVPDFRKFRLAESRGRLEDNERGQVPECRLNFAAGCVRTVSRPLPAVSTTEHPIGDAGSPPRLKI